MIYYLRLDDACEKRNHSNWDKMELILDKYDVRPLVGVIPECKDESMEIYQFDKDFWNRVHSWVEKGWEIALHGYDHVCITKSGGLNPVNYRSEFADVDLEIQKKKISRSIEIFMEHGIKPSVFFAPSHTFDNNTLVALKECSEIRIISDTIANKPYFYKGFTFIPQQSGAVRNLFFNTVTFCYHPNTMKEKDFERLEVFLSKYGARFKSFPVIASNRKINGIDLLLRKIYFARRKN